MILGSGLKADYKTLMQTCVCNIENKDCMLQQCEKCPGTSALEKYLSLMLIEDEGMDPEENIQFKQWLHTDRDSLITKILNVEEFITELASKVMALCSHHYISNHQSAYLKHLKENLKEGEVIILLDFAENYSFLIQDAAQGYHWDNTQATLHPFVVYYKSSTNILKCKSFCVVSDYLKHDTVAVHVFIKKLLESLLSLSINISHIYYFSDGAASQYKNYKNFLNLCFHKGDFNGISAEWNFFGTSHGKSPCDGVGGTAKRLAARASLQRPVNQQIMTPKDLYQFCRTEIKGITFIAVTSNEIEKERAEQETRFMNGHTVAGTRNNHYFVPINEYQLKVGRISGSEYTFIANVGIMSELDKRDLKLQPGQYVACLYDGFWWIGNIYEVDHKERDALIEFMHPHGITRHFYWPEKKDQCWIPEQHILCQISAPTPASTGRTYKLEDNVIKKVELFFHKTKKELKIQ